MEKEENITTNCGKLPKEESLSNKIWTKKKEAICYGNCIDVKFVKEFIDISEARIKNQIRIHWKWLKNRTPEEVSKFINAIINSKAGPKLITS